MKESILVFGGGELQISIIKKAMQLGLNTVVIDPDPYASAKEIADVFIQVEGDDFAKTLSIAQKYSIKGVVTTATDHPILMMCRIAAELKLNFPSYKSCETLLDKGQFKDFLKVNDLPHAKGEVFDSTINLNSISYQFPLIVKPVKNSGSRGVIKCENLADLKTGINECVQYCRDGRFIVEEYISGDEISVEAIVFEGQVEVIQITDKFVSAPPYNVELGHVQPSKYSLRHNEIKDMLQKIVQLNGFDNCAIHPEFKIDEKGKIVLIEIGTRLGGDYITSDLTPLSTNIDIELLQLLIAIGESFKIENSNRCSAISFLNFPVGSVVKETFSEQDLKEFFPEISRFCYTLKTGDIIKRVTNSLERYGYFIIQSKSIDEAHISCSKIDKFLQSKFLFND